jgi:hypothetical protein
MAANRWINDSRCNSGIVHIFRTAIGEVVPAFGCAEPAEQHSYGFHEPCKIAALDQTGRAVALKESKYAFGSGSSLGQHAA